MTFVDTLAPPETILDVLRRETRALHDRIEQNPQMRRLLADDLDRSAYRHLLMRTYGFYRPLEAALAAQGAFERFGTAPKRPALEQDLRALGVPEEAWAAVPQCGDLPAVDTVPQALGCMYVLEGASLGGRLIARHLADVLGIGPEDGAAFYNGALQPAGAGWRAFRRAAVDVMPAYAGQVPAAVTAARDTFRTLDAWMAGVAPGQDGMR